MNSKSNTFVGLFPAGILAPDALFLHKNMKLQTPPPVIASGRVVSFAVVDALVFAGQSSSVRDGQPSAQPIAGIALCERLGERDNGFFLAFCNADWKMLDTLHSVSPKVALQALGRRYPDIHLNWQDTDVTVLQALAWIASRRAAPSSQA